MKTLSKNEKVQFILEQVADGVWQQNYTELGTLSQCAFCYVAPENEHGEDCPVRIARELRDADL